MLGMATGTRFPGILRHSSNPGHRSAQFVLAGNGCVRVKVGSRWSRRSSAHRLRCLATARAAPNAAAPVRTRAQKIRPQFRTRPSVLISNTCCRFHHQLLERHVAPPMIGLSCFKIGSEARTRRSDPIQKHLFRILQTPRCVQARASSQF